MNDDQASRQTTRLKPLVRSAGRSRRTPDPPPSSSRSAWRSLTIRRESVSSPLLVIRGCASGVCASRCLPNAYCYRWSGFRSNCPAARAYSRCSRAVPVGAEGRPLPTPARAPGAVGARPALMTSSGGLLWRSPGWSLVGERDRRRARPRSTVVGRSVGAPRAQPAAQVRRASRWRCAARTACRLPPAQQTAPRASLTTPP
jgi:hypothetical protein